MPSAVKSVVTFVSDAFNNSEPREYFINDCCYGDDVCKWLIQQLRKNGNDIDETPGQEDFGWYFNYVASGIPHCFVLGHRPGDQNEVAIWIGWIERRRRLASILLRRDREIELKAAQAIHEVLSTLPVIRQLRWHLKSNFDKDLEELGSAMP